MSSTDQVLKVLHLLSISAVLCACSVTAAASVAESSVPAFKQTEPVGQTTSTVSQAEPGLAEAPPADLDEAGRASTQDDPGPASPEPCTPPDIRDLQTWHFGELLRGDPSVPLMALTFDAGAGSGTIS